MAGPYTNQLEAIIETNKRLEAELAELKVENARLKTPPKEKKVKKKFKGLIPGSFLAWFFTFLFFPLSPVLLVFTSRADAEDRSYTNAARAAFPFAVTLGVISYFLRGLEFFAAGGTCFLCALALAAIAYSIIAYSLYLGASRFFFIREE